MTRPILLRLRAPSLALALGAGAMLWPVVASAQEKADPTAQAAPADDTIRLTDEQRMQILDGIIKGDTAGRPGNASEVDADADGDLAQLPGTRRNGVHGEVGVMIGSHGTRGAYGTADIPLGQNAGATVSFESSRFGYGRR
jgi:hypothetical protein